MSIQFWTMPVNIFLPLLLFLQLLGFELRPLFVFGGIGDELRAYTLSYSISLFCDGFFPDKLSQTISSGQDLNFNPPDLCLLGS
jgi:hypothetical protein